jgi:UDP-N-acetylmuramoyl-L-alanyl-D-glutamate--2,6-diaminopimelate ligase
MIRPVQEFKRSSKELANYLGLACELDFGFTGVVSNSKDLIPGDLFVAMPGNQNHGAKFADTAKSSGAVAVITDSEGAGLVGGKLPTLVVENPRKILGNICAWFYDFPTTKFSLIGITGTNGKTTTTSLLHQIWSLANKESALIGTTGIVIGGDTYDTSFTTPEAPEIATIFATIYERHIPLAAMEVSSHAIELGRISGSKFRIAAFTNLTQDHLDFHGDMASYFGAKSKLFTHEYAELGFINIDDGYGQRLFETAKIPVIGIAKSNKKAQWHYETFDPFTGGYEVAIRGTGGILIEGRVNLIGEHNLDNLLMAVAIAYETGIDPLLISGNLQLLTSPAGRLEQVNLGQQFLALVDYAHTPDAVSRVLASLRAQTTGKIIAVLGCGGDRDRTKRALMGSKLQAGSDIAIFTSDNPRTENPEAILTEMTSQLALREHDAVMSDRLEAIAFAVTSANPGDCVVLLGKGHETGQEISGIKHPFDDRIELARAIEELS